MEQYADNAIYKSAGLQLEKNDAVIVIQTCD